MMGRGQEENRVSLSRDNNPPESNPLERFEETKNITERYQVSQKENCIVKQLKI